MGGVAACAYVGAHFSGPILAEAMVTRGIKGLAYGLASFGVDLAAGAGVGYREKLLYKKFGME